jgi:sarcosine oxidase, subunit gamma
MDKAVPLWALKVPGLTVTETPVALSRLNLRAADETVTSALGAALGLSWPTTPNTVAGAKPMVAWLAPGEWAIFAAAESIFDIIARACDGRLHHLADLSAGRRQWRIEGAKARTLIAKGCSLDTHPSVLGAGRCAQSLLAQVPILLIRDREDLSFGVIADASFSGHLRAWVTDACQEFQP